MRNACVRMCEWSGQKKPSFRSKQRLPRLVETERGSRDRLMDWCYQLQNISKFRVSEKQESFLRKRVECVRNLEKIISIEQSKRILIFAPCQNLTHQSSISENGFLSKYRQVVEFVWKYESGISTPPSSFDWSGSNAEQVCKYVSTRNIDESQIVCLDCIRVLPEYR